MAKVVTKRSWLKRLLWAVLALTVIFILTVVALRVFITTAPGARFIEAQINKRSFGPIEGVEVSGLSGDPLKELSIELVTIRDKDGVWLRAQNIDLRYKPFAFFKQHLWIKQLDVSQTDVLRPPILNPSSSNGKPLTITFEGFDFKSVNLEEDLVGQSLHLESSGRFVSNPVGAIEAKFKVARLDAIGETIDLDFSREVNGNMQGVFDIDGAAGGPIAEFLRAPQGQTVSGSGTIAGTLESGDGKLSVAFGDDAVIASEAYWTKAEIIGDAVISLNNWPAFDSVQQRLGSDLKSTLRVDRGDKAFSVALNVPGLSIKAMGYLPDEGYRPATANVEVRAANLSDFLPLSEGFAIGEASADGRADLAEPYGFDGRISARNIAAPQGRASALTGPVILSKTGDLISINADWVVSDLVTAVELPIDLARDTTLKSTGVFNLGQGLVTIKSASVTSGPQKITAQGTLNIDGQSFSMTGKADVGVKSQGSISAGRLRTDYQIKKTQSSSLALIADGAFAPSEALREPFGGLVGEQMVFTAKMMPIPGGLNITDARISGDNAKAAISGRIGDSFDLSGEAVVSGPIDYQNVAISGGAEGSFTLQGARTTPTLRLDAKAGAVRIKGQTLEDARLRTELSNLLDAPNGPLQIDGKTQYGPLSASTRFASEPGVYVANDLDMSIGRLSASGDLRYPEDGIATGEVSLNLPEQNGQYARADLTLSNRAGEQGVDLNIDAKQVEFAGVNLDEVQLQAAGTLAGLTGNLRVRGQRGENLIARKVELDSPITLTQGPDQSYTLTLSPKAKYGDINISSREPVLATYRAGELSFIAPLAVSDGVIHLAYNKEPDQERLVVKATRLPITMIPMPGNLADTRGRINGDIELISRGGILGGGGVITINDWRGFEVAREQGLTSELRLTIDGAQADAALSAKSPAGFKADGQLRLPLTLGASLASVRLHDTAPLSGEFVASGAAASVFGLFTPSDSELGGTLDADIKISGTASAPRVEGRAGGKDIRFEAPELGTRIRQGRFTANFTNNSLTVRDVYAADGADGSLTATGDFTLGELGRPIGKMLIQAENFRALDRKDIEARLKGDLTFESKPKRAILSGDVTINQVNMKQFVSGSVSVVEIPVDEINKPNTSDKFIIAAPQTPIDLDLRIRAPRRIFIRSRGLDVEMSVDATLKGTLTEPLFYGEAKVLRGGYKIAGKTLDFESGTIKFDGDLKSAKVDFIAKTETQNLEASVSIKGTVESPEIEVSSTPERPQDEILSALLFGRSATELSTIEAAQLAGSLAQLSGKGGLDLLGGIRDAFGVAELSLNFNPDGSKQLVGGRYLSKNVYLQVFSGAGPDQTGAIIDWELRKNIALRSRIRADNDQALSLKWKKDF